MLKYGYSICLKPLFPSVFEKQNVKLALKIYNPCVMQALVHFGSSINKSKDTADFILLFYSYMMENCKCRNSSQEETFKGYISRACCSKNSSDPKLEFLDKYWIGLMFIN